MLLNIFISIAFFSKIGFIIIPISTSISTWVGVIIYISLLNKKNHLLPRDYLLKNIIKIILNTAINVIYFNFSLGSFF